jgi:hypothetical protein
MGMLERIDSNTITRSAFANVFVPNGFPKLILVDEGSEFKGELTSFCATLGIHYHVVSPEAHNGILCERFHKYLNKVLRLMGADLETHERWVMNILFAVYAWNASPIDGTDIIRSFAAKARTFRFPLEVQEEENAVIRIPPMEGEAAIRHTETMFPLWYQQKELLKLLNDLRRERHRDLKHQKRTNARIFNPGELVIVRKQRKSNARDGQPEKLALKAKGPYRVLEEAGQGSYWVQKLPVLQGINRRKGKRRREAAFRLERIPSSVVIHKRLDSADTRFAQLENELIRNPLEQNLGFFDFGRFHKAAANADHAFVRVNEMWDEEVETDSSDSSEEEETTETNTNEPETKTTLPETEQPKEPEPRRSKRRKTVITSSPKTERQLKQELWETIKKSKDKLFFIARRKAGQELGEWFTVQVDEEETNDTKARKYGEYHVRYYIKNYTESKKRLTRNCQFWPLLHELEPTGWLGPMIQVRPNKVEEWLETKAEKYIWYQDTINLATDMIYGPFDFDKEKMHHIPETAWKELLDKAEEYQIDATDVNEVKQLHDQKRKK